MPTQILEMCPTTYSEKTFLRVAKELEHTLRTAIESAGRKKTDYRVETKATQPSGFRQGVAPIDIEIWYNEEWNFTEEELAKVLRIVTMLVRTVVDIDYPRRKHEISVRMVRREGHKSLRTNEKAR